jgi:hypothetical protein
MKGDVGVDNPGVEVVDFGNTGTSIILSLPDGKDMPIFTHGGTH